MGNSDDNLKKDTPLGNTNISLAEPYLFFLVGAMLGAIGTFLFHFLTAPLSNLLLINPPLEELAWYQSKLIVFLSIVIASGLVILVIEISTSLLRIPKGKRWGVVRAGMAFSVLLINIPAYHLIVYVIQYW